MKSKITIEIPESYDEIQKVSYSLLEESKAWGILPTPVDKIVQYSDLILDNRVNLSQIHPGFLSRNLTVLKRALNKILGALDYRKKTIYLDLSQNENRKRFVKLHEVGHKVLYWQNKILRLDDDYTLNPDCKEVLEQEANIFASSTLFQLERFEDESKKLPLEISSAMYLAKLFGSSNHAALRRYVEYSKKRCALLILEFMGENGYLLRKRNYFQSLSFTKEFGVLSWPSVFGGTLPFVSDIYRKRKFHTNGEFNYNQKLKFDYHFFNNTYNSYFIFIKPKMEHSKSKITFILGKKAVIS